MKFDGAAKGDPGLEAAGSALEGLVVARAVAGARCRDVGLASIVLPRARPSTRGPQSRDGIHRSAIELSFARGHHERAAGATPIPRVRWLHEPATRHSAHHPPPSRPARTR